MPHRRPTALLLLALLLASACASAPPCPAAAWRAHVAQCRAQCDDPWGDSPCVYACEDANTVPGCHD